MSNVFSFFSKTDLYLISILMCFSTLENLKNISHLILSVISTSEKKIGIS